MLENDLKELKEAINAKFEKIDNLTNRGLISDTENRKIKLNIIEDVIENLEKALKILNTMKKDMEIDMLIDKIRNENKYLIESLIEQNIKNNEYKGE
jgi:ribosomal protein L28